MYQTIAGRCTEIINGVGSRQFHALAHNTTYVFGSEVFDAIVINAAIDVDEVFYVIVKETFSLNISNIVCYMIRLVFMHLTT